MERARGFVSKIKRPVDGTVREPLDLLCRAGILRMVRGAERKWCCRRPAVYALAPEYAGGVKDLVVEMPSCFVKKRSLASERRAEKRRRLYPFLEQLEADMRGFSVATDDDGRAAWAEMVKSERYKHAIGGMVDLLGGLDHEIKIDNVGQVTTVFSRCPNVAKPFLRFHGEAIVSCDVGFAHHCFFPELVRRRISIICQRNGDAAVGHYKGELARWAEYLEGDEDYYARWQRSPGDAKERQAIKKLINAALNSPRPPGNGVAAQGEGKGKKKKRKTRNLAAEALYWRIQEAFPYTIKMLEDIKRDNHCALSDPLRRLTATAINGALLEAQKLGIPAVPLVDAIYCRESDRAVVCELIGRKMYEVSGGVCCLVNGVRYKPRGGHSETRKAGGDIAALSSARRPGQRLGQADVAEAHVPPGGEEASLPSATT